MESLEHSKAEEETLLDKWFMWPKEIPKLEGQFVFKIITLFLSLKDITSWLSVRSLLMETNKWFNKYFEKRYGFVKLITNCWNFIFIIRNWWYDNWYMINDSITDDMIIDNMITDGIIDDIFTDIW